MDRLNPEFHRSRWLEAIWEPGACIYALPGGIDMIDISGDGDARLIAADLGISVQETARVLIYKYTHTYIYIYITFSFRLKVLL